MCKKHNTCVKESLIKYELIDKKPYQNGNTLCLSMLELGGFLFIRFFFSKCL